MESRSHAQRATAIWIVGRSGLYRDRSVAARLSRGAVAPVGNRTRRPAHRLSVEFFHQLLAPIHKGWMWVGHILGWINTRILLSIVFYALVTPIGLVFRLMGKDTMRQAFAESSTTYRVVRSPRPHSHMKYQF